MKYEPLAIDITQNGGHTYHQVWRDADSAVYEQRGHYNQLLGYEAIRIRRREAETAFGKQYPAREVYPSSEDWGTWAVSKNDLDEAIAAAQALVKKAISTSKVSRRRTK